MSVLAHVVDLIRAQLTTWDNSYIKSVFPPDGSIGEYTICFAAAHILCRLAVCHTGAGTFKSNLVFFLESSLVRVPVAFARKRIAGSENRGVAS